MSDIPFPSPAQLEEEDAQLEQAAENRRKELTNATLRKLALWFFFSVLVALVPFAAAALAFAFAGQSISIVGVLARGELFIVAAAIASAAIGELFASSPKHVLTTLILSGFSILALTVACIAYGLIRAMGTSAAVLSEPTVAAWSGVIFGLTLLTGAGCMILSEVSNDS